jgi:hypothetical protein
MDLKSAKERGETLENWRGLIRIEAKSDAVNRRPRIVARPVTGGGLPGWRLFSSSF